jgi:aspartate/methionine/tyrosine aminotransferase
VKRFDLSFGNSVAVRKAFLETYNGHMVVFSAHSLERFNYPERTGDPELIEITKQVIKRQTGQEYKHVMLTNGATGGVVIALRAYAQQGREFCHTRKAPWYTRYPGMIKAAGLAHDDQEIFTFDNQSVVLLDLPSNPLALIDNPYWDVPTILDGVYFNKVYMRSTIVNVPRHDVMVGSYSKLTGVNGLRCGWVATNDDLLADRLGALITSEYCGLSAADTEILKTAMRDLNWDYFEEHARNYLDDNRESFSKLEKFFGGTKVADIGMFAYVPIDEQCRKLLEKTGIIWTKGSDMGTDDSFGRFNLGADPMILRRAVTAMLQTDKIS